MPITLEKDPFMERPENYIVEEQVTLDNTTGRIFKLDYGCFFGENLVVRKVGDNNPLRPMIDFTALHIQEDAVAESGREVLTIIRSDLANWEGDYLVSYHAYGGEYSTNAAMIEQLINNEGGQLENVPWGTIFGKPDEYNPAAHVHVVGEDILKWNDLVEAIDRMADAVRAGGVESIDAIFNYMEARFQAVATQISAAISQHNSAGTAHSKDALGLSQLSNLPPTDKSKLNTSTQSYLTYNFLREAVGLALSNGVRALSPGALKEPAAVISTSIPALSTGTQNFVIIQGGTGNEVIEATSPRWQIAICISPAAFGAMGVRLRDASSWTGWTRMDVGKLNNVPNYEAADLGTAAHIAEDTSVNDKLATPAISRVIAQNVSAAHQKTIYTETRTSQTASFVEITFPNELGGKQMRVDFTAVAGAGGEGDFIDVAAINSVGATIGSYTLPSWANPFVGGQALPFSGSFIITVPSSANKTVRFSADHNGTTSTPEGAFVRLDAYRI